MINRLFFLLITLIFSIINNTSVSEFEQPPFSFKILSLHDQLLGGFSLFSNCSISCLPRWHLGAWGRERDLMGSLDTHCALNSQVSMTISLVYLMVPGFLAFETEVRSWIPLGFWLQCKMEYVVEFAGTISFTSALLVQGSSWASAVDFISPQPYLTPFQGLSCSTPLENCVSGGFHPRPKSILVMLLSELAFTFHTSP